MMVAEPDVVLVASTVRVMELPAAKSMSVKSKEN